MDYLSIKYVHQSAVILSGIGFIVRGLASLRGSNWTQGRMAKSVPHVVDTVLLFSAVAMAFLANLSPLQTPWLLAKILGLIVYILLGVVALRIRIGRQIRLTAWVLAIFVLSWIVSVAVIKSPWGFFSVDGT